MALSKFHFFRHYNHDDELTWIRSVGPGRVVQDEHAGEVGADGGEVLGVGPGVQGAVLPVVPAVTACMRT